MASRVPVRRVAAVTGLAVAALGVNMVGVTAQGSEVTVGSNYSDALPKEAFQATLDYCATQTGDTYKVNTVDHGTFQDQINSPSAPTAWARRTTWTPAATTSSS